MDIRDEDYDKELEEDFYPTARAQSQDVKLTMSNMDGIYLVRNVNKGQVDVVARTIYVPSIIFSECYSLYHTVLLFSVLY